MAYNTSTLVVSGTLTSAQIKSLHATPIAVIPAPGASNMIWVNTALLAFHYGGNNAFVAASGQTIALFYGTAQTTGLNLSNASVTGTAGTIAQAPLTFANVATTTFAGVALNLYNSVATEISGNAANDNVVFYYIEYKIIPT